MYKTNKIYAYNNIFISKTKLDAIEEIRKNISIEKNKTLLVLGPHPWIYFVLNAKPNTPFLFNHSMIENNKRAIKIQEFVISKINSNEPDYIIDALPESSFFFKKNIETFINKYSCKEFLVNDKINSLLKKEVHFKLPSIIKFCSK
jgi:hypothetical protein